MRQEHRLEEGRLILGRFGRQVIECHRQQDGFYTRDDRLIVDWANRPAEPEEWAPIAKAQRGRNN